MAELSAFTVFVLPIGLRLLGFVEPCSIGSTLMFFKYLEKRDAAVAASSASGLAFAAGFTSLALFGLALSLPLVRTKGCVSRSSLLGLTYNKLSMNAEKSRTVCADSSAWTNSLLAGSS